MDAGIEFDVLFGPAYKGIPIASATAVQLVEQHDVDVPWCFNRKEAKDHGEGGNLVGSPLKGRIMLVDDVITAGTAIRESMDLIQANGASLAGVLIALDRQEKGKGELSAIQEVERDYGAHIIAIIQMSDLIQYLEEKQAEQPELAAQLAAMKAYRAQYGIESPPLPAIVEGGMQPFVLWQQTGAVFSSAKSRIMWLELALTVKVRVWSSARVWCRRVPGRNNMTTHLQSPIHLQLPLSGMSCANCAGRITTALNKLDGVSATVNFALEQAAIELTSPDRLPAVLESIQAQGYDYGSETILFQITGMTCAGCSARLNKMLAALPGVISADVNFSIEQARIVLVPGMQTSAGLREQIEALGFGAQLAQGSASGRRQQLLEREAQEAASARQAQTRVIVSALLTLPLLVGMLAMAGLLPWHLPAWLELVLATPVQFWIGARFYRGAWLAIKNRSANMDVLVATGTSAAYFYSLYLLLTLGMAASGQLYFEASAIIITLISLGKLLEARARRSTQSAIRELMALRPETATVWRGERWQSVAIDEVLRGDRLQVLVGNGYRWMAES